MAADQTSTFGPAYALKADSTLTLSTSVKEWAINDANTNPAGRPLKLALQSSGAWLYGSDPAYVIWPVAAGAVQELQVANGASIFVKAVAATPALVAMRIPS